MHILIHLLMDIKDSTFTPSRKEFRRLARNANFIPVYGRFSADLETPVSAYLKVRRGAYSFLLESVEGGERLGRYSFIGTEPSRIIRTGAGEKDGKRDPLEVLKEYLKHIEWTPVQGLPKFSGGAVGYIAYDVIQYFEQRVPPATEEPTGMNVPEAVFMLTDSLLAFDHLRHEIVIISHARVGKDPDAAYDKACASIEEMAHRLDKPLPPQPRISPRSGADTLPPISTEAIEDIRAGRPPPNYPKDAYFANMTREEYNDAISQCKHNITTGEVIQIVFSHRMARNTKSAPFDTYRSLRSINPSPYMFFLDLDGFQIIGASPELLVSVQNGEVAVHPIAGTRPRGASDEEDDALAKDLLEDEKEIAEHVMLLDLGRNDVGRVAVPGSVRVEKQMEIERYSHVMHIVSHVTGKLDERLDALDALRSAFPAGTVSGAPKVRAMELIADLEPNKRGVYSGAVGYIAYSGNMDTCIALRTMMVKDGVSYIHAGGGIVADSTADNEYRETLYKLGALMRAIEDAEGRNIQIDTANR